MHAMVLKSTAPMADRPEPLVWSQCPDPAPAAGEVRIDVSVCGVCHTELDEIEGRLPPATLPIILGHQAVGRVAAVGDGAEGLKAGDRVGVAWINWACGVCEFCRRGDENLCLRFRATGRDVNGGYAEQMTVPAAFAHAIPDALADVDAAPLLCAGAIGFRSLQLCDLRDGEPLGLTGFGASAHLVLQLARHRLPNSPIFVFARSENERGFARELGAAWAGNTTQRAPQPLHAIIDTTPAWTPVVQALSNLERGGRLIINAIRKENADKDALLKLDYARHLWHERQIKSVANVTRNDVREFLRAAAEIPLRPQVQEYALPDANQALADLKHGDNRGAKVLRVR